jgi:Zn finger protein HypA/HybF involved in hydrogenase expression
MVAEKRKEETITCHICKKEYPPNKLLFVDEMAICPKCQSIDGYE